jgi:hypothetical protein
MITNTGKNIVAKYLIGDASAYASYIALGCGQRPRPNITEKTGVGMALLQGTIAATATTTQVTGISTAGLVVGMTLTKTTGAGAFGGVTTIKSIDSPSQITIQSTTVNTTGSVTFRTGGVAALLSVSSITGLWKGAKITILSGAGVLDTISDTIITALTYNNTFTITPGPNTILSNTTIGLEIDPAKESLEFEMFRIPISSRGYVNDDGTNKIILTAQLPTEERYEISEIGIYSAGSNPSARQYDSRTISAFSSEEPWDLIVGSTINSPEPVTTLAEAQAAVYPNIQISLINPQNQITLNNIAIKTTTANGLFSSSTRIARYERPRFLNNVLLLRGTSSNIYEDSDSSKFVPYGDAPAFLQTIGQSVDLSQNSPSDLMKVAFSIIATNGSSNEVPNNARIVIDFSNSLGNEFARLSVDAKNTESLFSDNRYIVATKRLDELFYSTGQFSWKNVNVIKAYASTIDSLVVDEKALTTAGVATLTTASAHGLVVGDWVNVNLENDTFNGTHRVTEVLNSGTSFKYTIVSEDDIEAVTTSSGEGTVEVPAKNFYIAIDAIRIDNISTVNPLYGLTGYSIIQNVDEESIVKSPNTSNYIEYRFILDVT